MSKGLSRKVARITGGSIGRLMMKLRVFYGPKLRVEDFEAAALPHLDKLYRPASLLLPNGAQAEHLVQEVYLQAWKSFHRVAPETDCRAWLFEILFRHLHHLRRWLRDSGVDGLASPANEDDTRALPPVPPDIRNEDILLALEKIPGRFREVVLMAEVEQFSYKNIADVLKVPLGKVMRRIGHGRELLRQELARICGNSTESGQAANGTRKGDPVRAFYPCVAGAGKVMRISYGPVEKRSLGD